MKISLRQLTFLWVVIIISVCSMANNARGMRPVLVSASASYDKHLPGMAFDGNRSTFWQAPAGSGWLQCQFAKQVRITGVETIFNKDHLVDARLEISDSVGGPFRLLAQKKNIAGGKWRVSFAPMRVLRVRTVILRCAHKWTPEKSGEWPYIYEQTFIRYPKKETGTKTISKLASELPQAKIPILKNPDVVVDGNLNESVWRDAVLLSNFTWEGKLVSQQTIVRIFASRDRLFLGVTAFEKDMSKIRAKYTKNGENLWSDDCIELFAAPFAQPFAYTHVGINVNGASTFDYYSGKKGTSVGVKVRVVRQSNCWILEASIPFSALALPRVKSGTSWRLNICRNEIPHREISTWSALQGGFHKPNRFGKVTFSEDPSIRGIGVYPLKSEAGGKLFFKATGPQGATITWDVSGTSNETRTFSLTGRIPVTLNFVPKHLPQTGQFIICYGSSEVYRTASITLPRNPLVNEMSLLRSLFSECQEVLTTAGVSASMRRQAARLQEKLTRLEKMDLEKIKLADLVQLKKDLCRVRLRLIAAEMAGSGEVPAALVCAASAMKKVLPTQPWSDPLSRKIDIHAARGEYENAQLVIFSLGSELRKVHVKLTELRRLDSGDIFRGEVNLYNVGNVACKPGSGTYVLPGGIYPDPLLPHIPFDLGKDEIKAVWLEVYIPRETKPGTYTGKIKITWDGQQSNTLLDLKLQVYSVTLPRTHFLATPFGISPAKIAKYYKLKVGSREYKSMMEKYRRFNVRHRLDWFYFPGGGSKQQTLYPKCVYENGKFRWDFTEFDRLMEKYFEEGMNSFSVGFSWAHLPPIVNTTGKIIPEYSGKAVTQIPESVAYAFQKALTEYARHLKQKGWFNKAYYYVCDEPRAKDFPLVKKQARFLLDSDKEWRTMVTLMVPALGEYFKIWCPNLAFFDPVLSKKEQSAGKEVWWYVCTGRYHPNYFIDFEAIDPRIHFWLTYRYGLKGVLYWRVNSWQGNPFKRVSSYGDGYIFYPGPDGPLPSIRSMMIRDGIEDYDLLKLLENKNNSSKLLDVSDVCQDTGNYTHNPAVLESHRRRILNILSD